jgi:dihydroflavonol-4-reductase
MRVLVTGGNGFIGSVVVRQLVESGYSVRCLLRKSSNISRISNLQFERMDGDIRAPGAVRTALDGCTHVIHLASLVNWKDMRSTEMRDVVVEGTRNVLQAAQEANCRRIVYVSSTLAICGSSKPEVFNEASLPDPAMNKLSYSKSKMQAERLCIEAAAHGLDVVIVNPGEVYGPQDITMVTSGNLVDFASSSPVLVCAGGTAIAYVEDVAKGILAALEKGRSGERYILCGSNLTVRELAELTLRILKRNTRLIQLPNSAVQLLAWMGKHLKLPLPFNPEVIPYATRFWFMDNARARSELGVVFRSPEETLRPTLSWLHQHGYVK